MSVTPLSNAQILAKEREQKEKEKQLQLAKEKEMFSFPKLAQMSGLDEQMLMVIQNSVAKDTSPAEFAYFLSVAKDQQLSAINKEIWCYKNHKGDVIIFTGRDGFLKRNKMMPSYRGMKTAEVCELDEFEIDMVTNEITNHKITNNRGKLIGAYCVVYHDGMEPTTVYLDFEEFDLGQAKWKTSPKMMLKKCAQSHALKEAAGITGIQAAESWNVKDGVASADKQEQATEDVSHEEVRLEELINSAPDLETLNKHLKHCETPAMINLFNKRKKELGA